MSNLFWLTDEQMARLRAFFPKSHGKPRVDGPSLRPDPPRQIAVGFRQLSRPKAYLKPTAGGRRSPPGPSPAIGDSRSCQSANCAIKAASEVTIRNAASCSSEIPVIAVGPAANAVTHARQA